MCAYSHLRASETKLEARDRKVVEKVAVRDRTLAVRDRKVAVRDRKLSKEIAARDREVAARDLKLIEDAKALELKLAAMNLKLEEMQGELKEQVARVEGSLNKALLEFVTRCGYERLRSAVAIHPTTEARIGGSSGATK